MRTLLELSFPLASEMMTTVRLATGGVCSTAGLDLDASEDCKVCVTESLLLLKHAGCRSGRIRFTEDGGLAVRVEGGDYGEAEEAPEDEISLALLGALAADFSAERPGGKLARIAFRFLK